MREIVDWHRSHSVVYRDMCERVNFRGEILGLKLI